MSAGPAWFYRKGKDGAVESKIFEDGKCPRGWKDTPADLMASDEMPEPDEPPKQDPVE